MAEDLTVLEAVPISREAFAPYGLLIACPGRGEPRGVNEGTAERWDDQAPCDNPRPGAKLNIATFQARPRPLPFDVVTLEKHPYSTQIFVPLHASRYVVVVADGAGAAPEGLHAFVVAGDRVLAERLAPHADRPRFTRLVRVLRVGGRIARGLPRDPARRRSAT
jgi:ureidoglycolate lyase